MLTSAREVQAKIAAGKAGRWACQHGVYLQVAAGANGATSSWLFRYERDGRSIWMGLGATELITLHEAREEAKALRKLRRQAIDPLRHRRELHAQRRAEERARLNFRTAVAEFLALHEGGWKNLKHRWQWRTTLQGVFPKLGDCEVAHIDQALVNETVAPLAKTPETASRVKQRIERVVQWVRDGKPLPQVAASKRVRHYAALPWAEIPAFMQRLRGLDSISAQALEFTILTAARTGETIGATWDEIDLDAKLWVIPGSRMKMGVAHSVPLSDRVVELLTALPRQKGNDHVFIGARSGKGLSNMAMLQCARGLGDGLTVHGFRSTFKDWCSEATHVANIVSEAALAHRIADKTEAAYRRGTMLQKRARLMADWAAFCAAPPAGASVLPLVRKQA